MMMAMMMVFNGDDHDDCDYGDDNRLKCRVDFRLTSNFIDEYLCKIFYLELAVIFRAFQ